MKIKNNTVIITVLFNDGGINETRNAGVTETLIKNATEEFLEYGFTKASLRRIAGSSGVSTNSIYTRFKDKEGLFKAIVDDAAAGLMNIYLESIQKAKESTNLDQACLEGG